MEADNAVGDLPIGCELSNRGRVLFGLLKKDPAGLSRSRSGKDAAFPEDSMKKGARYAAPLVRLASAIDDQIDCDIETSKLPAEPSVLLSAAAKVRLDDKQVQIAVRLSLAPSTRPEENDVGVGSSGGEPAPSLLDQSLVAHCHSFRSVVAA
jgi:hypothetical protein